jgi:predicted transcriptional regulator of viral defense system
MIRRGDIVSIKRGIYTFPNTKIDEFVVANKLYAPSYVSLESVLNTSGIMPDITSSVTNVTTITSKKLVTPLGSFTYSKIAKGLFFGYKTVRDPLSDFYYGIAEPEKALLDFIYVRRIKNLSENRIDLSTLDKKLLANYSTYFPKWVRKVIKNA